MPDPRDLLARVLAIRVRLRMTYASLAMVLNVNPQTVWRWSKGLTVPRFPIVLHAMQEFIRKHELDQPIAEVKRKPRPLRERKA